MGYPCECGRANGVPERGLVVVVDQMQGEDLAAFETWQAPHPPDKRRVGPASLAVDPATDRPWRNPNRQGLPHSHG